MKKAKKVKALTEPPQDLIAQTKATEALSVVHTLLHKGAYHAKELPSLTSAIAFITSLHAQSLAKALKHPQADLIPELKSIKDHEKSV